MCLPDLRTGVNKRLHSFHFESLDGLKQSMLKNIYYYNLRFGQRKNPVVCHKFGGTFISKTKGHIYALLLKHQVVSSAVQNEGCSLHSQVV